MWVLIKSLKHKTWWLMIITTTASCLSMKGRRMGMLSRDSMVVETSRATTLFLEEVWFRRVREGWGERWGDSLWVGVGGWGDIVGETRAKS